MARDRADSSHGEGRTSVCMPHMLCEPLVPPSPRTAPKAEEVATPRLTPPRLSSSTRHSRWWRQGFWLSSALRMRITAAYLTQSSAIAGVAGITTKEEFLRPEAYVFDACCRQTPTRDVVG